MIAMALLGEPSLVIADEPTTALDVTIQAQIVELVKKLREELNTSIIWITHDLSLLAGMVGPDNGYVFRFLSLKKPRLMISTRIRDTPIHWGC